MSLSRPNSLTLSTLVVVAFFALTPTAWGGYYYTNAGHNGSDGSSHGSYDNSWGDHDDGGHYTPPHQYSPPQTPVYDYDHSYSTPPVYHPYPVYYPVYQQPIIQQPIYYPTTYYYQQPQTYYQQPQTTYVYQPTSYVTPVSYTNPISYTNPVTYVSPSSQGSLTVSCSPSATNAGIGQPVSWVAQAGGGATPYTYSWSGSDGLSGSNSSMIKYYSSVGEKSGIVSVTSADGRAGTASCSSSVTIRNANNGYVAPAAPVETAPETPAPVQNTNQAAALFSIGNIPWQQIAALIILMLGMTIYYLIIERRKTA